MGGESDRKHRANGKPKGGKRPKSGRPSGASNTLAYGEVKAVKAAGLRVPENVSPEARDLADEALGVLTSVMRGRVHFQDAGPRLKAATRIREEVCGPLAQKLEHSGPDGGPLKVSIQIVRTVAAPKPQEEQRYQAAPGAKEFGEGEQ